MNMGIKVLMQTSKTLKSKNDIIKPLKKGTMHSTKNMWNPTSNLNGKHSGRMNVKFFHIPPDIIASESFGTINTLFGEQRLFQINPKRHG